MLALKSNRRKLRCRLVSWVSGQPEPASDWVQVSVAAWDPGSALPRSGSIHVHRKGPMCRVEGKAWLNAVLDPGGHDAVCCAHLDEWLSRGYSMPPKANATQELGDNPEEHNT